MKIISLVPSITETLFDFGLNSNEIIGRTKFCIHPKNKVGEIVKIGGTKNLNIDKINALNPDLIIANKEENTKEQVEELIKNHKVWVTDIQTLEDNENFISALGEKVNQPQRASQINQKINQILTDNKISSPIKVAYLIWRKPYMSVGGDTFIHHILEVLGFENVFKNQTRYPEIKINDLQKTDFVFLSSEPYPFSEKHIQELQEELPHIPIKLVDGEAFSWYGSHLLKCEDYFEHLKHQILQNLG